ncbi:MAG: 2-dehydropantoate 2-reductase [Pseudomonadota bacterium]
MRKICIYGVGAIGGWMGARLGALPGISISAVARGAALEALKTKGLQLSSGEQHLTIPVQVSDDPKDLGPQDVVVLAVKAPALPDVAKRIAPLLGPDTMVYTAMNGVPWWFLNGFGGAYANVGLHSVDPNGVLARSIPAASVVGGVVHASCSLDAPGHVRHHFGNGLIVGEPNGTLSKRAQTWQSLLVQAGFDATLSQRIQHDIWFKLWGNMTVNPISALTGATTDRIMNDELLVGFISEVMLEAKAIGARIGIDITQSPEDRHAVTRKLGAFTTSMLQDVQAGRSVELDALVSSVQELGQITQVNTPFTNALLGLARLHARGLGLYPE